MSEISPERLTALEEAVEADPGASCFPALAELHRRAGRLAESEQVLRQGLERKPDSRDAQLVLAGVMLDQGREAEAREALRGLTDALLSSHGVAAGAERRAAPARPLSESELEAAFESAETDMDEVIDPNRVAEEALDHVDRAGDASGDGLVEPGGLFSTESMAELLERQGDVAGAARIRDRLERRAEGPSDERPSDEPARPADPARGDRAELIATLERWLGNLRRRAR